MIKEAISFVEKFEADQTQQQNREDWKSKKFIIINTKEDNEKLAYDSFEVLGNDDQIKIWLNNNSHYTTFFENITQYTKPIVNEKALGSNSGLLSMSFFSFGLSQKNIGGFEKKIEKTKFNEEDRNLLARITEIQALIKNFLKDINLNEKEEKRYKYMGYLVVLRVKPKLLIDWIGLVDKFIEERYSAGRSNQKIIQGLCVSCQKISNLATPILLTNYDGEKKFLQHKTRQSEDSQGTPILICSECIQKINSFEKILKDNKIRIFPLFINPNEVSEEIKIIKGDLEEDKNTFAFIFDELKSRTKKSIFDFYLVVMSGNYFFFDYVAGYKWELGKYVQFFGKEENQFTINRQGFEIKICNILTSGSWINYFDDKIKGSDNQQASLIYAVRQKLFDFVYRNQNAFTINNLINIVLFRIEKEIKNDSAKRLQCREFLNIYFNKHLLEGNEMDKEKILLNRIKPVKDAIISGNFDKFEIRDDEEWAYWAGQIAYFLISRSKSNDKTFGLLEPFTNKSTTQLVKIAIKELFEKYKYDINLANQRFKAIISKVLAYEINKSFIDLKIPFYVGAFDDNAIYIKQEKIEIEEVE